MELQVNEIQIPERISFNYEELKQELVGTLKRYKGLVYTADQLKAAKADRAALNKLKKALNDERIKRERDYMLPFLEFKKQINELISLIDEPVSLIDSQVKAFDEQKKLEKRKEIEGVFKNDCDFPEWVTFEQVFKDYWLNAYMTIPAIRDELIAIKARIISDLAALSEMPAFAFEATEVYKQTLNLQTAVNEGKRLAEIQKRKEEAERQKAEAARIAAEYEQNASSGKKFPEDYLESEPEPELPAWEKPQGQWIAFKALLTIPQAKELRAFFEQRGIEFKAI